jgi:hypothetical protein
MGPPLLRWQWLIDVGVGVPNAILKARYPSTRSDCYCGI